MNHELILKQYNKSISNFAIALTDNIRREFTTVNMPEKFWIMPFLQAHLYGVLALGVGNALDKMITGNDFDPDEVADVIGEFNVFKTLYETIKAELEAPVFELSFEVDKDAEDYETYQSFHPEYVALIEAGTEQKPEGHTTH